MYIFFCKPFILTKNKLFLKKKKRFQRLHKAFGDPLTEVVLLFHHASIPLFATFNKPLQSDEPLVHVVHDAVTKFARTLENRVFKATVIKSTTSSLADIDMSDSEVYIPHQSIYLGEMTKTSLEKLLKEGDVSERSYNCLISWRAGALHYRIFPDIYKFKMADSERRVCFDDIFRENLINHNKETLQSYCGSINL